LRLSDNFICNRQDDELFAADIVFFWSFISLELNIIPHSTLITLIDKADTSNTTFIEKIVLSICIYNFCEINRFFDFNKQNAIKYSDINFKELRKDFLKAIINSSEINLKKGLIEYTICLSDYSFLKNATHETVKFIPRNIIKLIRKFANLGSMEAEFILYLIQDSNDSWLERSAESEFIPALFQLGISKLSLSNEDIAYECFETIIGIYKQDKCYSDLTSSYLYDLGFYRLDKNKNPVYDEECLNFFNDHISLCCDEYLPKLESEYEKNFDEKIIEKIDDLESSVDLWIKKNIVNYY